jgi:putative membrane protein
MSFAGEIVPRVDRAPRFTQTPGPGWPDRFPALLLVVFALVWLALGGAPHYRQDWLLENVLVVIAVPTLVWSHRRVPLTNGAYLALFAFGVLHEIGAHYTYSEVPYARWLQVLAGDRNQYDRVLHFCYGLLVTPAAMQLIEARAAPKGWWRWVLPVAFVASHSVLYELLEWAAALVFGGNLRMAYLGTQGDPWDAQQDMAQALAGSAIAATLVLWRLRAKAPASAAGYPSRSS